ncbi:diguanylate cyclase domain-containing protein [Marinibaculum pumilum]|uniref:Diguanylate cyclase domain-containing protein n=1 Tax=Marinibaculum pumilum TaxID=1766165 RepID=A0ABV7LAP2_9PROT
MTSKSKTVRPAVALPEILGLQAVVEAMPVAMSWASLENARILFMNAKFRDLFGYDLGDFETVQDWVDGAYPVAAQRDRATATWIDTFGRCALQPREIAPVEVDVRCRNGRIRTVIHGGALVPEAGLAVATFVDISERKRDEQLIRHLAEADPLTGLHNRRAFEVHLAHAVTEARLAGQPMHLLVLDLDHFKAVNDRLGHQNGDLLLKTAGARIAASVRSSDPVARFGGDEFGVILMGSATREQVGQICRKITDAMAAPVLLAGEQITIGVSIGAARFPDDAADQDALFEAADRALYRVKRGGRGHWRFAGAGDIAR